ALDGIVFAVIFIEKANENLIKMSFRSKGDFDVNKFARAHFEGGGHINAAGGKSNLSLNDTIVKFNEILPQYSEDLKK
ncbi:MAG: bifunctional oligoribonuclease/PAP phosphatase NrnA, partial [Gramella sp.]|nr:bifunctional oligoribonuclease/PAP phosphatase NrnA [Christiangramia sp.]